MHKVEIFGAGMFHCPRCEDTNFFREYAVQYAPNTTIPGTDLPDRGFVGYPVDWYICRNCGYELLHHERESAHPMTGGGGALLPAWFFTCEQCGIDNFTGKTIYHTNGAEGPPTYVSCVECEVEYYAELEGKNV